MTIQLAKLRTQAYKKAIPSVILMIVATVLISLLGVTQGALKINLMSPLTSLEQAVIWNIRFPRVVMTLTTGAGLAMCGLVLQALTRNPLADPGIIGVSSFAALFAAVALFTSGSLLLPVWFIPFYLPLMAFSGAVLALLLLMVIASSKQSINTLVLILTGVALNAGAATLLGLIVYLADDDTLRAITFWQLGSYSGISWAHAFTALGIIGICYGYITKNTRKIMVIQLGEQQAIFQGIPVPQLKRVLLIVVAIVTAICVCFTGIVGFIGLVVPHVTRMLVGANLVILLPSSALVGASLVTLADLCARLWVAPAELPIGLLTSALGVPFFLGLILREKRKYTYD